MLKKHQTLHKITIKHTLKFQCTIFILKKRLIINKMNENYFKKN